jgi:hypothetical protein
VTYCGLGDANRLAKEAQSSEAQRGGVEVREVEERGCDRIIVVSDITCCRYEEELRHRSRVVHSVQKMCGMNKITYCLGSEDYLHGEARFYEWATPVLKAAYCKHALRLRDSRHICLDCVGVI